MGKVSKSDRPDYAYWKASRKERRDFDLEALEEELRCYSEARFTIGRRFRLRSEYGGIPEGTCCTVSKRWPDTRVLWDAWGRRPSREATVSYELDVRLEPVGNLKDLGSTNAKALAARILEMRRKG